MNSTANRLFLSLMLVIISFTTEAGRYKIIGYISAPVKADKVLAKKFTHLNYTFASVENGEAVIAASDSINLTALNGLRKYNKNLKILISIGGEEGSSGFSAAVSANDSREKLAASIIELINKYNLDGIELHWIFNAAGKFENSFSHDDQHNYTLLMALLRSKLDIESLKNQRAKKDYYILSLAGNTKRQYLAFSGLNKAHVYLDYINLQTYNYEYTIVNGGGVVKGITMTSHYSNLYSSRQDKAFKLCADANVNEYLDFTIPSKKLILCVSFSAKGWSGVYEEDHGLCQTADSVIGVMPQYMVNEKYTKASGYTAYWDEHAQASYLYNEETGVFISYESKKAVRKKMSYIRRLKLGGVACIEYGMDEENLLLKKVNKGLRGPAFPWSFKKSYHPRNPNINKRIQRKRTEQYINS